MMRWLFASVVAGLACSPMPAPVDGGRPVVDAGPPRVVDGGVVGPFARGLLLVSQTVREEVTRTTASFAVENINNVDHRIMDSGLNEPGTNAIFTVETRF